MLVPVAGLPGRSEPPLLGSSAMGMSRRVLVIFTFGAALLVGGFAGLTVSVVPASSLVGVRFLCVFWAAFVALYCFLPWLRWLRPFRLGLPILVIYHISSVSLRKSIYVYKSNSQRETEEKARQPETKLRAIARTRHIAGLRDAKRSRTRNPKTTHRARDRPKQPQPRVGRDRAYVYIDGRKRPRQPKKKPGAIARTRHTARLCNAKRSRTRNPKTTHRARDRPKQPQPRVGRDRASEPGRRQASRRTRPTDTGTRCPGKGQRQAPEAPPSVNIYVDTSRKQE
jgi:hypothetical protein